MNSEKLELESAIHRADLCEVHFLGHEPYGIRELKRLEIIKELCILSPEGSEFPGIIDGFGTSVALQLLKLGGVARVCALIHRSAGLIFQLFN